MPSTKQSRKACPGSPLPGFRKVTKNSNLLEWAFDVAVKNDGDRRRDATSATPPGDRSKDRAAPSRVETSDSSSSSDSTLMLSSPWALARKHRGLHDDDPRDLSFLTQETVPEWASYDSDTDSCVCIVPEPESTHSRSGVALASVRDYYDDDDENSCCSDSSDSSSSTSSSVASAAEASESMASSVAASESSDAESVFSTMSKGVHFADEIGLPLQDVRHFVGDDGGGSVDGDGDVGEGSIDDDQGP